MVASYGNKELGANLVFYALYSEWIHGHRVYLTTQFAVV
jgi:hypothetical protein